MITRRVLLATAMAGLATTTRAQDGAAGGSIQALNDALLKVMHAGTSVPFVQRLVMLTPVIQKVFDLPTLLENSVGPAKWNAIGAAQKADLLDAFTLFTVSSYVGNFDAFNGETFVIAPEQRKVGKDIIIATRLNGTSGDVTRIDYQMRDTAGAWRVVDILLDGSISRVAVTRSDFRALLAQGTTAGDAAPLIASLRAKSASLAAGVTP